MFIIVTLGSPDGSFMLQKMDITSPYPCLLSVKILSIFQMLLTDLVGGKYYSFYIFSLYFCIVTPSFIVADVTA